MSTTAPADETSTMPADISTTTPAPPRWSAFAAGCRGWSRMAMAAAQRQKSGRDGLRAPSLYTALCSVDKGTPMCDWASPSAAATSAGPQQALAATAATTSVRDGLCGSHILFWLREVEGTIPKGRWSGQDHVPPAISPLPLRSGKSRGRSRKEGGPGKTTYLRRSPPFRCARPLYSLLRSAMRNWQRLASAAKPKTGSCLGGWVESELTRKRLLKVDM